jgi:hypothetical protein
LTYKKNVPRFFLISGSGLIFLSVLLLWATAAHIISGENIYDYGYDRPGLYIIFVLSLVPVFLFEIDIKFTKRFLLIPLIEFIMFGAIQPMCLFAYAVEPGIGLYIAELGVLFQLIGIIIAVMFESLNKQVIFYPPPNQFILDNYYR